MNATANYTTTPNPAQSRLAKAVLYDLFTRSVNEGKIINAINIMLDDDEYKYFDLKSRKDFIKFCKYQDMFDEENTQSSLDQTMSLLNETCDKSDYMFVSLLNTEEGVYHAIKYKSLKYLNESIVLTFMSLLHDGKLKRENVMYFIDVLLEQDCWPKCKPSRINDDGILYYIIHGQEFTDSDKLKALSYFLQSKVKVNTTVFYSTIFCSNSYQQEVIDFLETIEFRKINPANIQTMAEIFTKNYSVFALEYIFNKGYSGLAGIIRTYIENINVHDNYTPKLINLIISKKPRKPSPNMIKLAMEALYDLMRYRDFYKNLNLSHEHTIESKIEDINAILNLSNK